MQKRKKEFGSEGGKIFVEPLKNFFCKRRGGSKAIEGRILSILAILAFFLQEIVQTEMNLLGKGLAAGILV
jgi:hypothetical protein